MIEFLKKQGLRLKLYAYENYQNEAESLLVWYAVAYALGAAFYFAFPYELPVWLLVVFLEAVLLLLYLNNRREGTFKFLTYLAVFSLGLCIAKANALYQNQSIEKNIEETTYISGQVKVTDYNSAGRRRIELINADNFEKPLKGSYKISLNQNLPWLKSGVCVELIAKFPQNYTPNPLSNYNMDRANFYQGVSASGYAISPVFQKECEHSPSVIANLITAMRQAVLKALSPANPETQGIIKALTIGDKSTISQSQAADYRTSGLAHFLAISGMHMGMIALLAFFLIRLLFFNLGEGRYDLRKPAALIALAVTFVYFLISGQSISCIRAFIMTSIILLAVLLNRRAISLRLWAFAVIIVVSIMPEAVISPGFLMSFAAVLGLTAFYEKNAAKLHHWFAQKSLLGKILTYITGVLITDFVASLMTTPYSLYYFRQFSLYTSLGNLLAAPVIAFVIMPALLAFLITVPFGGSTLCLKLLSAGVGLLNDITAYVASLPNAKNGEGLSQMPDWGIFLITLGLLWFCIWQEKWRFWGIVAIVLGLSSLLTAPKPDFVFDATGQTYACRDEKGKLTPTPWHKNKFLIRSWTGQTPQKGKLIPNPNLSCTKEDCTCQTRITFSKGEVKLDNRPVELKSGGFINLDKGIYYTPHRSPRIWDK